MKLENSFTVAAPIDQTWETLLDIERVATCLPGAKIEPGDEDGVYRGAMKVKLGPMTVDYRGTATLQDVDEDTHTRLDRGPGARGQGPGNGRRGDPQPARARTAARGGRGHRPEDHRPPGPVRPRDHGGRRDHDDGRVREAARGRDPARAGDRATATRPQPPRPQPRASRGGAGTRGRRRRARGARPRQRALRETPMVRYGGHRRRRRCCSCCVLAGLLRGRTPAAHLQPQPAPVKPPRFDYHDPRSVDEALALLAEHGDEGKVLAGRPEPRPAAQLPPRPSRAPDRPQPHRLAGRHPARGRHAADRRDDPPVDARASPLVAAQLAAADRGAALRRARPDPQPRDRRRLGRARRSRCRAAGRVHGSRRAIPRRARTRRADDRAGDFFVTHLTTTIEPDELLVEIEVPPRRRDGPGHAFTEFARRHGDFALGGAAVADHRRRARALRARPRSRLLAAAPDSRCGPRRQSEALVGERIDEALAPRRRRGRVAGHQARPATSTDRPSTASA